MELMKTLIIAAALALLGAPAAHAQGQPPATTTAPVPDPASLTADWWKYLSEGGADLAQRGERLQERLDAIAGSLTQVGEPHDSIRTLVIELSGIITQYVDATGRTPPAAAPLHVAQESYTIQRYLELVSQLREQEFELALETDEVAREKEALASADRAVKNRLAAYLELPPGVPERLPDGLRLMHARLLWGVGTEDLRLRRAREEHLKTSVEQLAGVAAEAASRLTATEADIAEWRTRHETARAERKRLNEAVSAARLTGSVFADDDRGQARKRHHAQVVRDFEVKVLRARVQEGQAELAVALGEHLLLPSPERTETLRRARRTLDELLSPLEAQLRTYRQATDRERAAAQRLLTQSSDKGVALGELHRSRVEQADATIQSLNRLNREVAESAALLHVSNRQLAESQGTLESVGVQASELLESALTTAKSWGSLSLFTLNETPVTPLGLIRFTVILVVAWWLSRLVRRGLERLMGRRDTMNQASIYTLNRLFHYVILVIGFFVAFSSIGIDFTKFALIASAFGVGLGFGLQAIFSNFVAGLIILFERSLKVGDFVEVESGVTGEVREINIRSTLVTTNDNIDMLLPNSEFVNGRVINWTLREAYRRLRVPFGVAYGTDKDLVRKAGLEAASEVPFTLHGVQGREPQVWLVGFGDSSLDFELVVWLRPEAVKRPSAVNATYCWAIETALGRHGIEIPFPQRDLHLRSWFGHRDGPPLQMAAGRGDVSAAGLAHG